MPDEKAIEDFNRLGEPLIRILVTALVFFILMAAMAHGLARWELTQDGPEGAQLSELAAQLLEQGLRGALPGPPIVIDRHAPLLDGRVNESDLGWPPTRRAVLVGVFLAYLSLFTASWFCYFMSAETDSFYRARSLHQEEAVKRFQEKSRVTMTGMAILVAASVFVLTPVNNILITAKPERSMEVACVFMATVSAVAALISFIISVDLSDTSLNSFGSNGPRLLRHFYFQMINRRMMGLCLLLNGIFFVLAFHSPLFSATAIAVVLVVGHTHWFPPPIATATDGKPKLFRLSVEQILFIATPAIIALQNWLTTIGAV